MLGSIHSAFVDVDSEADTCSSESLSIDQPSSSIYSGGGMSNRKRRHESDDNYTDHILNFMREQRRLDILALNDALTQSNRTMLDGLSQILAKFIQPNSTTQHGYTFPKPDNYQRVFPKAGKSNFNLKTSCHTVEQVRIIMLSIINLNMPQNLFMLTYYARLRSIMVLNNVVYNER